MKRIPIHAPFYLFVLALFLSTCGCATIINGTTQKIPVSSEPSGANCTVVGDNTKYTTPCQVELARKSDHFLKLEKEGYDPATVEIKHVLSGAVAGNILLGGLIGWGVDAATGSQNRLIPETVHISFKASSPSTTGDPLAARTDEVARAKSLTEQIAELEQLRDAGKITDEEFRTMRQKVIDNR
jgi:hypothetical protein